MMTSSPEIEFVSNISATPPVDIPTVLPIYKDDNSDLYATTNRYSYNSPFSKAFIAEVREASIAPIHPNKFLNIGVFKATEDANP